jgi:hypothetical protein
MIAALVVLPWLVQERPRELARMLSVPLEPGTGVEEASLADLDGDGAREVLLALHGPSSARWLEAWRLEPRGVLARAQRVELTPDVVAFAHADVLAGGGEELVLFNAGGAFAWRGAAEGRPVRLFSAELLWQTSERRSLFEWRNGVLDLDGDGLLDLVAPEPGGLSVALQRRRDGVEPWGVVSRVRVPADPDDPGVWRSPEAEREGVEARSGNGSFSLGFRAGGGDPDETADLVAIEARVPAPAWLDWDADGDLDLLLETKKLLHVWLQGEHGAFASAPSLSLPLPVVADKTRELDASFSSHAVDLDLDKRADCAVFAGDKRSDDVRTQGLFFTQRSAQGAAPLFGAEGRPQSLLVFAGFVSDPTFRDLDGDGYPELVLRSFRPDLIDQIQSAASESIDSDLFVYRNRRGVLAREPELKWTQAMPMDGESAAEFVTDLTGDGLAELLVRDGEEHVRVLMLRAGRGEKGAWSLGEKPLWELNVAKGARVTVEHGRAGERDSLLVREPTQVLWVRFE